MRLSNGLLLIGKNGIDRQILCSMFDREFKVYESDSMEAGRQIVDDGLADIVIFDTINFYDSAVELVKYIKGDAKLRRIVLIAVVSDDISRSYELIKLGVNYTIRKPYDPTIVKLTISSIKDTFLLERDSLNRRIDEYTERYKSYMDTSPGGHIVVVKSDDYRITYVNEKAVRLLKYGESALLKTSKGLFDYVAKDDVDKFKEAIEIKASGGSVARVRVEIRRGDGKYKPYDVSIKETLHENGSKYYDIVIVPAPVKIEKEEILKRELARFQKVSMLDPLTKVLSKDAFISETSKLIEKYASTNFVVGVFNIDRFKAVNELFGSHTGDKIICEFAGLISEIFAETTATIGRLESDHFAFCVPVDFWEDKQKDIDKILSGEVPWNSLSYSIFLHVGLYKVEAADKDIAVMCDRANLALSKIKDSFINRRMFFSLAMRDSLVTEQEIMRDARSAIDNEEFYVLYQPIVDVQTKEIVAAEALVRWRKADGSFVSPGDFIPTFERNGFVSQLDAYVWEHVCQFQYKRREAGKSIVPISVNFSRMDFYNPNLFEDIVSITNKYNLGSDCLKIEITESAYMDQPQELMNIIQKFQDDGYKVLMDDFGSGFSSLNMLKDVSVDVLKIDMRFMDSLETSDKAGNILFSIIQMAKAIQMDVVAEGVETANQYEMLLSMDCDHIQGYYFFRPLPEEEFAIKLDNNKKEMNIANIKGYAKIVCLSDAPECREKLDLALADDCDLIYVPTAEKVIDCLKSQFSAVSMILADFVVTATEANRLLDMLKTKSFYSDIPVVGLVSVNNENVVADYIGNGLKDVLRVPYSKVLLKKRLDNIIELAEVETEKRAVSILRKNMVSHQQINSFFDESPAGIIRVKVNSADVNSVSELIYVNDSFLRIMGTSVERLMKTNSLKEFSSNIRSGVRNRLIAKLRAAIMEGKQSVHELLEVECSDGDIKEIDAVFTMKYHVNDVVMDAILIEHEAGTKNSTEKMFVRFFDYVSGSQKTHMWQYYVEEDIVEYYHRNVDGNSCKRLANSGYADMVRNLNILPQDEKLFEAIHVSLKNGVQEVSKRFRLIPRGADAADFFEANITFIRIDDDYYPGNVYLAILEDVSDKVESTRVRWRAKQYLSMLDDQPGLFVEADLTRNFVLYAESNSSIKVESAVKYKSYDDIINVLLNYLDEEEAGKIRRKLTREYLLSEYEKGNRNVNVGFMFMPQGSLVYKWCYCKITMGADIKGGSILCVIKVASYDASVEFGYNELQLMERDSLTGLCNRVMLEKSMDKFFKMKKGTDINSCFMIIDVDNFKVVNDVFGHDVGDSVLRTISRVIASKFGDNEIICRLGGDEFGIFVPQVESQEIISCKLQEICKDATLNLNNQGEKIYVSCSIGCAMITDAKNDFKHVYPMADKALSTAKEKGKDGYYIS